MNIQTAINQRVTSQSEEKLMMALDQLTQNNALIADNRWVFLVAPKKLPSKQQLLDANIDINRLLIIHTSTEQLSAVSLKAISSGNASAVVCWGVEVEASEREEFNLATKDNNCLFMSVSR